MMDFGIICRIEPEHCTFVAKDHDILQRHMVNCHGIVSDDISNADWRCAFHPLCEFVGPNEYELRLHIEHEHTEGSQFVVSGVAAVADSLSHKFQYQEHEDGPPSSSSTSQQGSSSHTSEADPETILCDLCTEYVSASDRREHMAAHQDGEATGSEFSETCSDAGSHRTGSTPQRRKSPNAAAEGGAKKKRRLSRTKDLKLGQERDETQAALDELDIDNDNNYSSSQDLGANGFDAENPIHIPSTPPALQPDHNTRDPDFGKSYYEPISPRAEVIMETGRRTSSRKVAQTSKPSLLKKVFSKSTSTTSGSNNSSKAQKMAEDDEIARKVEELKKLGDSGPSWVQESIANQAPRGPRPGKTKELGSLCNRVRAPSNVIELMKSGGKFETVEGTNSRRYITFRDENNKPVSVPKISNETPGLIPLLARLSEFEPHLKKTWLCHPRVKFVTKESSKTRDFCGYRTIQMMLSYAQAVKVEGGERLYGCENKVPTVFELQELIEDAWYKGIQTNSLGFTGGIIYTQKYIGTPEAVAAIKNLGMERVIMPCHEYPGSPALPKLFDYVLKHFSEGTELLSDPIIYTDKPCLYLQLSGHSIAVVGIQQYNDGTLALLVFDSAKEIDRDLMALLEAENLNEALRDIKKPSEFLTRFRRPARTFQGKKGYEVATFVPFAPPGEEPDSTYVLEGSLTRAKPHKASIEPELNEKFRAFARAEFEADQKRMENLAAARRLAAEKRKAKARGKGKGKGKVVKK